MLFTYDFYEKLLDVIAKNHEAVDARQILDGKEGPWCFHRHDVDNGLELAIPLAQIEQSKKVSATYFLMTSSSVYNCFTADTRAMVKGLLSMGHNLGLHFCLKSHGIYEKNSIVAGILREKQFLEDTFDAQIDAVSFHQPAQAVDSQDNKISSFDFSLREHGLLNTYSTADTNGATYSSDSLMNFKLADPLKYFANEDLEKIQLLTHPIWYGEDESDAESRWDRGMLLRYESMLCSKIANEKSMNAARRVRLDRTE